VAEPAARGFERALTVAPGRVAGLHTGMRFNLVGLHRRGARHARVEVRAVAARVPDAAVGVALKAAPDRVSGRRAPARAGNSYGSSSPITTAITARSRV
jgi:hypothetical protein